MTAEKSRFVHVQACSAKTGEGLEDGLAKLVEAVNKNKGA